MSRVTTTVIAEGAIGATADANSTLTSWNTASADLDASNVREEGLDRRNFASFAVTRTNAGLGYSNDGSESGIAAGGAFAQANIGGLVQTGSIVFDSATERCVVFCSVSVYIVASAGDQPQPQLELYYSINGGADVAIAETLGLYQAGSAQTALRKEYTVVHRLDEPTVTENDTVVVKLFRRATGTGTFDLERVNLFPEVYKR